MEQVKTKCASSQPAVSNWASVDWDRCERRVKKLQARIVMGCKSRCDTARLKHCNVSLLLLLTLKR